MTSALQSARRTRGWSQARTAWELTRLAQRQGLKVASASSLKTQLSRWENGHVTPDYYQGLLCALFQMAPEELLLDSDAPEASGGDRAAELSSRQEWLLTLERLDQEARWAPGTARKQVAACMTRLDADKLSDRAGRRRRISQREIADALAGYYGLGAGGEADGYRMHRAQVGSGVEVRTSILTRPDWLDLACPLDAVSDQLRLASAPSGHELSLAMGVSDKAAERLAEAVGSNGHLVDGPLYRLLDVAVDGAGISGSVAVMPFVRYALTMDLLEGELIDALAAGAPVRPGSLPLRDQYLPDLASVLDLRGRVCAGGVLALCAIARPASPDRGPADYALLVQERSGQVVNAAGRLAVVPKSFHQPMTDYQADARITATLRRAMERELFGRQAAGTLTGRQAADPMHPGRMSEPMHWLTAGAGWMHIEVGGFGFNLVSGNYEIACLVVIEPEEFWTRYGGQIEASWESSSLRIVSSHDSESIAELLGDPAWSNEGLFALLAGLTPLLAFTRRERP
jgi:transcriptional regulator with XRE-family HTH domain